MGLSGGVLGGLVGGLNGHGGVARLLRALAGMPLALKLNSISATPIAVFKAKYANASAWPASIGTSLSISGAGAAPTLGVATGLKNADDKVAVTFAATAGAQVYAAPNNTFLELDGTSDYVTECIFNTGPTTGTEDAVFSKSIGGGGGFLFYRQPAGTWNGLGAINSGTPFSLSASTWYHLLFVSRLGGNCRTYVNGVFQVTSACTMATVAAPFQFNAYGSSASPGPCSVAWFAQWKAVSLAAGTTAEMDALAAYRAALM